MLTFRRVVVFEHERALRYDDGRFRCLMGPGPHWVFSLAGARIVRIDVRPRLITAAGQELLTSDGVSIKISLVGIYEIVDPALAVNGIVDFNAALYSAIQLAAREVVASVDVESLLSTRTQHSERLLALAQPRAEALGLRLRELNIKDIMFPGRLKETFAQVVTARQEGLAALERARGESAALRNLANAARLLDGNPNLMQLRVLQVLGETSGNTVVLGALPERSVLPVPSTPRAGSTARRGKPHAEA